MGGVVLASLSGVGFGLFQTVNARSVQGASPAVASFVQLSIASIFLLVVTLGTADITLLLYAPWWASVNFAIAGILHFLGGWTLLIISQQRLGAARTSPLLATAPLFAATSAAVVLDQALTTTTVIAILVMVAGAATISQPGSTKRQRWRWAAALPALGTAFLWAVSPAFTVKGLAGLPSPLIGVTVGLVASVLCYGLLLRPWRSDFREVSSRGPWGLKWLAGFVVALSTLGRWAALDTTDVGVVLALGLLSVPVVLILAPLMSGRKAEQVTGRVWLGGGLVTVGALLFYLAP